MGSSLLLSVAFMTRPRLLVVVALGGFFLALRVAGADAQTNDTDSLGMSYPAARGAGAEGGRAARRGGDGRGTGDEVKRSSGAARRVPCDRVISRYNGDPNVERGRAVDLSTVARELNTSVIWVERCMLAYGKRLDRSHFESEESAEDRLEALEADEPEESAPEEIDAGPERSEHPERPRVLQSSKGLPTPGTGYEFPE